MADTQLEGTVLLHIAATGHGEAKAGDAAQVDEAPLACQVTACGQQEMYHWYCHILPFVLSAGATQPGKLLHLGRLGIAAVDADGCASRAA